MTPRTDSDIQLAQCRITGSSVAINATMELEREVKKLDRSTEDDDENDPSLKVNDVPAAPLLASLVRHGHHATPNCMSEETSMRRLLSVQLLCQFRIPSMVCGWNGAENVP